MRITFLEAEVPLTKTFSRNEKGELVKDGHPQITNYKTHIYDLREGRELEDMLGLIERHAALGHCLLKGNTKKDLDWESRAGSTESNEETQWLCIDIDGQKDAKSVDQVMGWLQLSDVSYIVQYSASMGVVPDKGLSAHVFVLLDKPLAPNAIKQWLVAMNFAVTEMKRGLNLSRTGNALRFTLDISTCQNDKLLYIAPPLLEDGVVDTFVGERISLVQRAKRVATLDMDAVSAAKNHTDIQEKMDELRAAKGLPKRQWDRVKRDGPVEYMPNPDVSFVSGHKESGDFVKLNLNNGDSWGYWHPKANPKYIYNYKGEPTYLTRELLPEYWREVHGQVIRGPAIGRDGLQCLGFRDFESAEYWNGTYDGAADRIQMARAKSAVQVGEFMLYSGCPVPDPMPVWDIVWRPGGSPLVDFDAEPRPKINRYVMSELERRWLSTPAEERDRLGEQMPQIVQDLFLHVLNSTDHTLVDFHWNWLAAIVQLKVNTGIAPVWHGTQGTGKGLIREKLLAPLLGPSNVQARRQKSLISEFNGWIDGCVLCWVDEVKMHHANWETADLESTLKHYITEDSLMVMNKFQMARPVQSYLNFIFPSNENVPVIISPDDRRFVVANFQPSKLPWGPREVQQLADAAWPFYCWLRRYPVDRERARRPIHTAAKASMSELGEDAVDRVVRALKQGDLTFLRDQRPADVSSLPYELREVAAEYVKLVLRIETERPSVLSREDIQLIVRHTIGAVPIGTSKFTKYLRHHGLELTKIKRPGGTNETFMGMRDIAWKEEQ